MDRVAIYYRVSTEKQDLDSQRQAVEKWIQDLPEEKRPKSTKVYKDEGISGKTVNRPDFQRMLQDAYEKKFDTIIVYKLDRFSRNATTATISVKEVQIEGILERTSLSVSNTNHIISARFMMRNRAVSN